jgi:hypothetical protein
MEDIIKYRGREIEIRQDEDAQSPADFGDTGLFLVANHRQCYIPEPGEKRIPDDTAELLARYKKTHWIFPLEAYIHSGVRLALSHEGSFPDRQWDVSQLGFVFVSKKEWRLSKKARAAALALIAEWNQYLSGDVWGYVVGDDSCWGFYGREYCEQEAKSVVDCQIKAELSAKLAKLKSFILAKVPVCYRKFDAVPA